MNCKQCEEISNTGTNFCTRKCRLVWIREHNIKGGKKKAEKAYERELMSYGLSSSALDKSSIGG